METAEEGVASSQVGWDARHSCLRVTLTPILRQKSTLIVSNKLWCPFIIGDQCPWFLCIAVFRNKLRNREVGRKACCRAGKRLRTLFHMLRGSHESIAGRCRLLSESPEKKRGLKRVIKIYDLTRFFWSLPSCHDNLHQDFFFFWLAKGTEVPPSRTDTWRPLFLRWSCQEVKWKSTLTSQSPLIFFVDLRPLSNNPRFIYYFDIPPPHRGIK